MNRAAKQHGDPLDPLDRIRFPVDEWRLIETGYEEDDLGAIETVFAVGNGYVGLRANAEEGRPAHVHGTFINGFHEIWPINHAEEAFGFARTGQTIVNIPDAKQIKLYVDDEPLQLAIASIEEYERSLDFADGIYRRHLVWLTPSGKRVHVDSTRMVSFTERHVAIFTLDVTVHGGSAPVVISSQVINRQDGADEYHSATTVDSTPEDAKHDPRQATKFSERVLQLEGEDYDEERSRMKLGYRCTNSKMTVAVGVDHEIETDNSYDSFNRSEQDLSKHVFRIQAEDGVPVRITKKVVYHTSRGVPVRELFDRCDRSLDRVVQRGVAAYHDEQREWLDRFWHNSDVRIADQPAVQQAVRWAIFHLAQASARADTMGIAAKGVTGSGYEGHYFWDTEVYIIPFLAYTNGIAARNALKFRANMLPSARGRARELSSRGALYPWRTINGEEASAYYAAGTAQYHINADIAHAMEKFAQITGDERFLAREGVDVLVETARMWADLGFWRQQADDGRSFHIHSVTGPDEYTTVVNNNLFTNVMARGNLAGAVRLVRHLQRDYPDDYEAARQRLEFTDEEVAEWEDCALGMFIPFDATLGVHPQDEHFLERELWDLAATPDEMRPLLLNFHPLVIYRFQVLKQADVVLAMFLQGDHFSQQEKRANFEYYDPITTGDSSLSAVVQSIIAAEVGYPEMALRYFHDALFVDLADLHANAADGVHIASAGGVWNALVYGFAGMRDYGSRLTFDPRLPEEWPELQFPITLCGHRLLITVTQTEISFELESGEPLRISVRREPHVVEPGKRLVVALDGQGPRRPSLEGHHPVIGAARADGSLITAGVPEIPDLHHDHGH